VISAESCYRKLSLSGTMTARLRAGSPTQLLSSYPESSPKTRPEMLVYFALPHRLAGGPALLERIEPVLPKRISPLSCGAQPSAFSSSAKCAFWRPGSFGDVVLTFHCQLPFFFRCRKSQLLSVKLWLARCGLSPVPVLRRFSRCPRIHLLSQVHNSIL